MQYLQQARTLQGLQYLVCSGRMNPNARFRIGDLHMHPLHFVLTYIMSRDNPRAGVELLLRFRADPNATTASGIAPLHLTNDPEQVALLIRYGANVWIQTPTGLGVLDTFIIPYDPSMWRQSRILMFTDALQILYDQCDHPCQPSTPPQTVDSEDVDDGYAVLNDIVAVTRCMSPPSYARLPVRRVLFP